ncbi:hypothetical protein J6590_082778, partial [Homalodisca vitripennis]
NLLGIGVTAPPTAHVRRGALAGKWKLIKSTECSATRSQVFGHILFVPEVGLFIWNILVTIGLNQRFNIHQHVLYRFFHQL